MHKGTRRKKRNTVPVWPLLKTMPLCGAAATVAMLLFALLLYLGWLGEEAIPVGNTAIKVLCALLAGAWIARTVTERPWLYGGLAGLLFTAFSTLLFALLVGKAPEVLPLLSDALLSAALGSASAMLFSWLRERKAGTKNTP